MHKLSLIVSSLLSASLFGCANTSHKLQAMWAIATDQYPIQPAGAPTQPYDLVVTQKHVYSDKQIVSGNRLSKKAKNQLIQANSMAKKAGGNVHVICPAGATFEILQEIEATGVTYNKDNAMREGYIVIFSKRKN
jgi:hypothetical protein